MLSNFKRFNVSHVNEITVISKMQMNFDFLVKMEKSKLKAFNGFNNFTLAFLLFDV